jgi:HAD superfamily hydrolase (TIGR01509 family)
VIVRPRFALEALLWDVDGTLAETERDGHRVAFNRAFAMLDVPWRWGEGRYAELLAVSGGRERLLHDMRERPEAPADPDQRESLAGRLHWLKNECYARIVAQAGMPLREGVRELFDDCARAGLRMAIVTTTSGSNVQALLGAHFGAGWRERFAAVICAEDAPRKKPDPQAYLIALRALRLAPQQVLAIEDAPAGVAAARAAGIPVVVTRSHYFGAADDDGALAAGPSLGSGDGWRAPLAAPDRSRIDLARLAAWHQAGVATQYKARSG